MVGNSLRVWLLENISLWDVTSTVQGVESTEPITLGAVLIAILVLIITTQLVRNFPALLELALLQHLDLTPGTGYAITTITKYLIMLFGGLVGFSMIGIEWSKLQWLVAALGVGLGFGLQEIFANFISGLIILFEKPIRIGDTVTIRDLTGSITRSTRAPPRSATGTVKRSSCRTRRLLPSSLSTGRCQTPSRVWC